MSLTISSPAFASNGEIPAKYTCEGANVSPPLAWTGIPSTAKSVALIVDDPDAPDPHNPRMTWVHWVLYNIPSTTDSLPEAATVADFPSGMLTGTNDFRTQSYGGPCPPIGKHRYFFKLYALDTILPDLKAPTKPQLLKAMDGHILAQGELVGTYKKKG